MQFCQSHLPKISINIPEPFLQAPRREGEEGLTVLQHHPASLCKECSLLLSVYLPVIMLWTFDSCPGGRESHRRDGNGDGVQYQSP